MTSSPPGFESRRLIGRGASCRVFEAHQHSTRRLVALKLIDADVGDTDVARRFDRECAAMGELSAHPNIVTVYDAGRHDRQPWIAMELCPAGSLADRLAQHGPASVADAAEVLAKIADALHTAHRRAVVHCDVKPANIMITEFGEPALGDFGIARLRVGHGGTSMPVGYTLNYAPPEALNGDPPGAAGDVYSLGVSVWHLLAGRAPFSRVDDSGLGVVIHRILSDPLPALNRADVPDDLLALLTEMTAKDPAGRPTDLSAVAERAAVIAARALGRTSVVSPVAVPPADPGDAVARYTSASTSTALTVPVRAASQRPVPAPRRLRRVPARIEGLLGRPAVRVAALIVVGLLLLGGVGVGLWRATGVTEESPVADASAPVITEPAPGVQPPPGAEPAPAVPVPPAASAQRPPRSTPATPAESAAPNPPPDKPGSVAPTGTHTLTQELAQGCTPSRYWSITGPFSLTVTPGGSVRGTASGRGTGSLQATCDGVTGTLNWDHEYTMEFAGQVIAGVAVATGTMIDTDRSTAVSCTKGGQPVACPAFPGAGTPRSFSVTVGGQVADGSGFGGVEVQAPTSTKGTWSVR